ncbi:hypothetical protein MicroSTF_13960 [Microbacterium sp. STF-2]|uniref:hypothetical protein n=1 Tax=Microbacterium sp. STF-2 TaxID=3031132 RepID=UPI002AFE659F|nr:hypothetical protein [Microbacterium sp. STF-2]MEA1264143.1 hypothetical protein [Microbacterium sp. STF-2]
MLNDRVVRLRARRKMSVVPLPSMVTDLETIFDVIDRVGSYLEMLHEPNADGNRPPISERYSVTRGEVERQVLSTLGTHERNSLVATVTVGIKTVTVSCNAASVHVSAADEGESDEAYFRAIKILLEGGSWRPTWRSLRFILPLLPLLLIVVGAVWVLATVEVPAGAVVAGVGAVVLLGAVAVHWSNRLRALTAHIPSGRIRIRGQSRQQTYADRADRWANFKAIAITAIISVPATLIAGFFTDWFGWG